MPFVTQPVIVKWGIAALLDAISQQLRNELRLGNFPDLNGEKIHFGGAAHEARGSPPSVIAVWQPSTFEGVYTNLEIPPATGAPIEPILNSLGTENLTFDFHCYAQAPFPDAEQQDDADACRFLYTQLIRVIHRGGEGNYKLLGMAPGQRAATELGARAILRVSFSTPIIDNLISYLPKGTTASITVSEAGETAAVINLTGAQLNPGGKAQDMDLHFPVGLISAQSNTVIPQGADIVRAYVQVTTPYSPGATLSLGQSGSISLLGATTDFNLQIAATTDCGSALGLPWGSASLPVLATIGGSPTVGAMTIYVVYNIAPGT